MIFLPLMVSLIDEWGVLNAALLLVLGFFSHSAATALTRTAASTGLTAIEHVLLLMASVYDCTTAYRA